MKKLNKEGKRDKIIIRYEEKYNGPGWYLIYWTDGSYTSCRGSEFIKMLWPNDQIDRQINRIEGINV